jgi:predicted outer membrane lipoprotein
MGIMKFLVYFALAMLFLFLSILLGEQAPWYFAWLPGTAMIILIAVSGAVLFEGQAKEEEQEEGA